MKRAHIILILIVLTASLAGIAQAQAQTPTLDTPVITATPTSTGINLARIRFERAGNRCEWCGAANRWFHPDTGSVVVLSTAHLDHDPRNNRESNLAALCQACHNRYDGPKRAANRKVYQSWDQEKAGQLPMDGIV